MIKFPRRPVLDADGKEIKLTNSELEMARELQPMVDRKLKNAGNDMGYQIPIDTLTTIIKKVSMQKNYKITFADHIPTKVGEGQFGQFLVGYKASNFTSPFADGIINNGGDSSRLASASAGVEPYSKSITGWAKEIGWNLFEVQQALMANSWDVVEAREKARRLNWDQGIQSIAFKGLPTVGSNVLGLLTQPLVTVNTSVITKAINTFSAAEMQTFVKSVIQAYQANCKYTTYPDRFGVPQSDWNGMAAFVSPDFMLPNTTYLEVLEGAFKKVTGNNDFKIFPIAYADATNHAECPSIAGKQVYVLYSNDEESLRYDIPCQYTATQAMSLDGFNLQNVAYGQFAGVNVIREREMLYFTYNA